MPEIRSTSLGIAYVDTKNILQTIILSDQQVRSDRVGALIYSNVFKRAMDN